jgi:hypothetical protein
VVASWIFSGSITLRRQTTNEYQTARYDHE